MPRYTFIDGDEFPYKAGGVSRITVERTAGNHERTLGPATYGYRTEDDRTNHLMEEARVLAARSSRESASTP
jgi:hypothetical protein